MGREEVCAFGSLECRAVLPLLFPQILFPVLSKEEGISVRFNQSHHQFAHPYLYIQSFFRSIFYRNSIAIIIKNETIPSVFLMAVEIAFPFLVFEVGSKSQVSVKVKARRSFKPPLSPPSPHLCLLSSILVSDCSPKDNRSDRQLFPFEEFCRVKAVAWLSMFSQGKFEDDPLLPSLLVTRTRESELEQCNSNERLVSFWGQFEKVSRMQALFLPRFFSFSLLLRFLFRLPRDGGRTLCER